MGVKKKYIRFFHGALQLLSTALQLSKHLKWKKCSERCKHCTRAGCSKVRTPARPPVANTLGLPTVLEWPWSSQNWPTVSCVPGEARFVPEMWKLTTGHGYMAVH